MWQAFKVLRAWGPVSTVSGVDVANQDFALFPEVCLPGKISSIGLEPLTPDEVFKESGSEPTGIAMFLWALLIHLEHL